MKPLDFLKNIKPYFSFKIKSSLEFYNSEKSQFYEVITAQGMMSLVIEKLERTKNG